MIATLAPPLPVLPVLRLVEDAIVGDLELAPLREITVALARTASQDMACGAAKREDNPRKVLV